MSRKGFFTPNDDAVIADSDSRSIQNAIDMASKCGCNKAIIPSYNKRTDSYVWEIDKTVLLPSDITLVLDNCYIRLADDVMCNVFCNSNCYSEAGGTLQGEQKNISIIGAGRAVIDGGNYNGLSEFNSSKDGNPHVSRNTSILFRNVNGFHVEKLHICNQRWWGMTYVFCSNGKISDIDFKADFSSVDENGNHLPGVKPKEYKDVYIKNADGIDIRSGCHNIIIENITGFTEDDTVALTVLKGSTERLFGVEGVSTDVHDIIIRNVMSDPYVCSNVRLLNKDGNKLYNILIDGIMDTTPNGTYYRSMGTVRIGDTWYTSVSECAPGDMYNITINNIISRGTTAVRFDGVAENIKISNIQMFDTDEYAISTKDGAKLKNILIDKISFAPDCTPQSIINLPGVSGTNVSVKNIYCEKMCKVANISEELELKISDCFADNISNKHNSSTYARKA